MHKDVEVKYDDINLPISEVTLKNTIGKMSIVVTKLGFHNDSTMRLHLKDKNSLADGKVMTVSLDAFDDFVDQINKLRKQTGYIR